MVRDFVFVLCFIFIISIVGRCIANTFYIVLEWYNCGVFIQRNFRI